MLHHRCLDRFSFVEARLDAALNVVGDHFDATPPAVIVAPESTLDRTGDPYAITPFEAGRVFVRIPEHGGNHVDPSTGLLRSCRYEVTDEG